MRKFLIKLALFFIPFILCALLIFLVDPYNLFHVSKLFSDETKIEVLNRTNASIPRGNTLWKTLEYLRFPTPNILLGDSKVAYLQNSVLSKRIGSPTYNLGSAGFNYYSVIEMFWVAAEKENLKNVIIEGNFFGYNEEYNNYNLFGPTRQVLDKPYTYLYNWDYLMDSFAILYYSISGDQHFVSRGYQRTNDNWGKSERIMHKVLDKNAFTYPQDIFDGLLEIAQYCKANDINLIVIIPPDFYEVHQFVEKTDLAADYKRFVADMNKLGVTFDYNSDELPFSRNRDFYADHFHVKMEYADSLIALLFQPEVLEAMKQ